MKQTFILLSAGRSLLRAKIFAAHPSAVSLTSKSFAAHAPPDGSMSSASSSASATLADDDHHQVYSRESTSTNMQSTELSQVQADALQGTITSR